MLNATAIALTIVVSLSIALCFGSPAAADDPYILRAGDQIVIAVIDHEEWSLDVIIRPDGRITYPATGEILVAGLSIDELTDRITHALGPGGHHLRNPRVIINVAEIRPSQIYVLGAVGAPGAVEIAGMHVTAREVLALAGGSLPEADLEHAALYRASGERLPLNLAAAINGTAEAVPVYPEELIIVPSIEPVVVGVLGHVGRPGAVSLELGRHEVDIVDLVVLAGGIRETADEERALVLRAGGAAETVSLKNLMERKAPSVHLQAGDVLWVLPAPEQRFVSVTGAVSRPGVFRYQDDLTLGEVLAQAGSLSAGANARKVSLIHAGGDTEYIDLQPVVRGEDTQTPLRRLQPDDIILVPQEYRSYLVTGAVGRAGSYTWEQGLRISDAMAAAGGVSERTADLRHVFLVRRGAEGTNPQVLELDVRDVLRGNDEQANWLLLPGDAIYVPQKDDQSWQNKYQGPLFLLGIWGTLSNLFD